jgi:signal transduction histidine kinase
VGQVVTNLVGNAIKFTPKGGSVEVVVAPFRDGARIDVNDTGTGIDASELPRIFERFYRGSRANEARGSGSGLGLAIVRSIVDMHGGSVTVDSRLGKGSRFSVFLPRDPRAEDAQPANVPFGQDEAADLSVSSPKMAETSPTPASRLNRESSS